ncbi:hypothetical protein J31TS4_09860 [Paenibacillus sp. J31TS4]|nr:hypothetical protein J31TS4_09860 [Paenibacillus sp. J31TS4]
MQRHRHRRSKESFIGRREFRAARQLGEPDGAGGDGNGAKREKRKGNTES